MKTPESYNQDQKNEELDLNQIELGYDSESELKMIRLPWSLWALSLVSIFCASFLLANLLGAKIFKAYDDRLWWQFFVIVILYVFGLIIFLFGKVEIVLFDKANKIFQESKWILCYKWKGFRTELDDVVNIALQKEGMKNDYEDSIHYKVLVSFRHTPPLRILETKNKTRALEKVKEIRDFLGIQGDIILRDVSRV